jgi:hypothetical protein
LYNTKEGIASLIHHVSFGGYEKIGAKNISTELSRSQYAAFLTGLVLDKIMIGYFTAAPLLLSGYQDPLEHYQVRYKHSYVFPHEQVEVGFLSTRHRDSVLLVRDCWIS